MTPAWEPANETERVLAAALDAGDIPAFARTVTTARLYLPAKRTDKEVTAFTSPESLRTVLGTKDSGYTEVGFSGLAPNVPFVLNPGLPITASMAPRDFVSVADGTATSIAAGDIRKAVTGELNALIRQACLDELGDGTPPAEAKPTNELERHLAEAAESKDPVALLDALVGAELVVPVSGPVPAPSQGEFPWRPVSAGALRVIALYSSPGLLDRPGSPNVPRAQVSFLDALADWPEDDHALCLNPGSRTELILPGDAVAELIDTLAESLAEAVPGLLAD